MKFNCSCSGDCPSNLVVIYATILGALCGTLYDHEKPNLITGLVNIIASVIAFTASVIGLILFFVLIGIIAMAGISIIISATVSLFISRLSDYLDSFVRKQLHWIHVGQQK